MSPPWCSSPLGRRSAQSRTTLVAGFCAASPRSRVRWRRLCRLAAHAHVPRRERRALGLLRLPSKESVTDDDIAVCAAAVAAEAAAGCGGASFWYLEAALIAPLREAIEPMARLGEGIPMGMYVLPPETQLLPPTRPPLPPGYALRRLEDADAPLVNRDSGMGPNRMSRAAIGCWGVVSYEAADAGCGGGGERLVGWAVRGADGAIGMLHVYPPHRHCGVATAVLRTICDELRRANLPCVAYVRDDNCASRAVFGRLGFERVGDVRWCMVRLGRQRL